MVFWLWFLSFMWFWCLKVKLLQKTLMIEMSHPGFLLVTGTRRRKTLPWGRSDKGSA